MGVISERDLNQAGGAMKAPMGDDAWWELFQFAPHQERARPAWLFPPLPPVLAKVAHADRRMTSAYRHFWDVAVEGIDAPVQVVFDIFPDTDDGQVMPGGQPRGLVFQAEAERRRRACNERGSTLYVVHFSNSEQSPKETLAAAVADFIKAYQAAKGQADKKI